ncbi:antibiotic biosynthesis monooxygenase family protein [Patulibacter sp. NPDC049589]|uniref:putative quinol monooxygenase n=1 Tax=Patulibacter sp. NPDC049589 TaxID=3154731 RepID=UPI003426F9A0
MLIVSGHLRIAPGRRDAFAAASLEAVVLAREAPGCLDFVVSADPLDPDRINVFERWSSTDELLAFRGDGPDDGMWADIVGADVHRYEIASVGPA